MMVKKLKKSEKWLSEGSQKEEMKVEFYIIRMQFNAVLSTTPLHQTLWHPNLSLSFLNLSGTPFFPTPFPLNSVCLALFSLFQVLNSQSINANTKKTDTIPLFPLPLFTPYNVITSGQHFCFSTQTVDFIGSMFLTHSLLAAPHSNTGCLFNLFSATTNSPLH